MVTNRPTRNCTRPDCHIAGPHDAHPPTSVPPPAPAARRLTGRSTTKATKAPKPSTFFQAIPAVPTTASPPRPSMSAPSPVLAPSTGVVSGAFSSPAPATGDEQIAPAGSVSTVPLFEPASYVPLNAGPSNSLRSTALRPSPPPQQQNPTADITVNEGGNSRGAQNPQSSSGDDSSDGAQRGNRVHEGNQQEVWEGDPAGSRKGKGKGKEKVKEKVKEKRRRRDLEGGDERPSRDEARAIRLANATPSLSFAKQRAHYQSQIKTLLSKVELLDIENGAVGLLLMSHPSVLGKNGKNMVPYYEAAYSEAVVDDTKMHDLQDFTFPKSAIPFVLPDDEETIYSRQAIYKTITSLFKLVVEEEQRGSVTVNVGRIDKMMSDIAELERNARKKEEEREREEQLRLETERVKAQRQREVLAERGFTEDEIRNLLDIR